MRAVVSGNSAFLHLGSQSKPAEQFYENVKNGRGPILPFFVTNFQKQLFSLRSSWALILLSGKRFKKKNIFLNSLTKSVISGHECKCMCKQMFLTFETFSNFIFPALVILGLYCLLDGENVFEHEKSISNNFYCCMVHSLYAINVSYIRSCLR